MAAADLENSLIIPRLESLESTLSEISYREAVKNASNFNARLTIDRKHRNPFLDSQTGIAHSPSTLYFNERQRLPGLRVGQIYSYPAKRWRKKRRQYLCNYNTVPIVQKKEESTSAVDAVVVPPTVAETPSVTNINEDSKDSIGIKDQESATSKDAWYYDEMEMHEMDCFDEPDPDSDFDYEESYSTKRKKKRSMAGSGGSRSRSSFGGGDSPNRRSGSRSSVAGSGAGVSGTPLQSSSNKVSNKKMTAGLGGAVKRRPTSTPKR
uniref:Zinc finger protein neuro-d4 n=1 Tax=Cacopsylla melanoneura TaxID=428564 RepID=A0A8D9BCS3_9HEMI